MFEMLILPLFQVKDNYNVLLVERLIRIMTLASQPNSKVRLSTLELSIRLLKLLVYTPGKSYLQDRHLACIENARECSNQLLRNFYKVCFLIENRLTNLYNYMIFSSSVLKKKSSYYDR